MLASELKKLHALRRDLRGTGLFCFERHGVFLLYREVRDGCNTKVLTSQSIDEFDRRVRKALSQRGGS